MYDRRGVPSRLLFFQDENHFVRPPSPPMILADLELGSETLELDVMACMSIPLVEIELEMTFCSTRYLDGSTSGWDGADFRKKRKYSSYKHESTPGFWQISFGYPALV